MTLCLVLFVSCCQVPNLYPGYGYVFGYVSISISISLVAVHYLNSGLRPLRTFVIVDAIEGIDAAALECKKVLRSVGVVGVFVMRSHLSVCTSCERKLQPVTTLTSISGTKFVCLMCTLTIVSSGEKPALDI